VTKLSESFVDGERHCSYGSKRVDAEEIETGRHLVVCEDEHGRECVVVWVANATSLRAAIGHLWIATRTPVE
jgi:hypothetical protein